MGAGNDTAMKVITLCAMAMAGAGSLLFGSIDPERLADWSQAGCEGAIPDYAHQIVFAEQGGLADGVTDNAALLQGLIDSLESDTVILLGEGDYVFSRGIDIDVSVHNHGVILRGVDPDRTRLVFTSGVPEYRGHLNTLGADTEVETRVNQTRNRGVWVADPSSFQIGDDVVLYQENDFEVMATAHTSGGNPGIQDQALRTWAKDTTGQILRIVSIEGNEVTFDREVRLDFEWSNRRLRKLVLRTGVGIENLTLDNRVDLDGLHSIKFTRAANCWVRNVRSIRTVRYHVSTALSRNLTIRDSYFYDSFRFGGGGSGYGVVVERYTSDCLVINNTLQRLRHALVAKEGANGNVFAYNYTFEGKQDGAPIAKDVSIHGHYPFKNLFEGNVVEFIHCTDWWGPAGPGNTFFRNRVSRMPVLLDDRSHGQNVIGNELVGGGHESGVLIIGTVLDTFLLGNVSELTLSQELEQIDALELPTSLWTRERPDFWTEDLPWPAMGPPHQPGSHQIPAQARAPLRPELPGDRA